MPILWLCTLDIWSKLYHGLNQVAGVYSSTQEGKTKKQYFIVNKKNSKVWSLRNWRGVTTVSTVLTNSDQVGNLQPTWLFKTNLFILDQLVKFLLILIYWSLVTPCWSLFGNFLFWNCSFFLFDHKINRNGYKNYI